MKKKRLFIIGLIILLLISPACMVFVTKNQRNSYKKILSNNINPYKLELLTMALESKTNPDYQPLLYSENVDQTGQNALNNLMNEMFDKVLEVEKYDEGFYYKAYNETTKQYYNSQKSYYPICYSGDIYHARDSKKASYGQFDIMKILNEGSFEDFMDTYYDFLTKKGSPHWIQINDKVIVDLDQVSINVPKSMTIHYYFTTSSTPMADDSEIFYSQDSITVLVTAALILGVIIFIYILACPMSIEENTNPYRTIKEWKFLSVILTIVSTLVIFAIASGTLGIFTIIGMLPASLSRLGFMYADTLCYAIYFLSIAIFYFLFSIICFIMKYIFTSGPIHYFKNNTVLYSLGFKFKKIGDQIMSFDLRDELNVTILKLVIVNTLVVLLLYELSPGYTVFGVVYMIISFLYIRKQMMKIKNDYKNMLDFTKQLSDGHFETEIVDDLGIFNSMRDRLNNIKNGFESAVKEETKSQNMKTELITNVSHDLKTPLTCIKNYVILLENTECDEETRKEYLTQLKIYTNRLANLIQDLFDVSKATSGNIELHPMNIRLSALLDQSLAECIEVLESKDIQVIKNVEDVEAYLDGDKTYRVFENLLTNIGKYAMPHSRAYIDIHDEEGHISVIFKNMSEVEMNFNSEEIQERFVRGDKSRHETGSGLGLAIAKSFVTAQNGTFDIDIDGDLFKVIMTFKKIKSVK